MSVQINYKGHKLSFDSIPTPDQIAQAYKRAQAAELKACAPSQYYPLSLAQKQIWFQEQTNLGTTTYNVPIGLTVEGALDIKAFYQALDAMVERHGLFRAKIVTVAGEPNLTINDDFTLNCPLVDISHWSAERMEQAAIERQQRLANTVFDLSCGPLMAFELVKRSATCFDFIAVFHHLITDQHSVNLLISELFQYYGSVIQGNSNPLAELELGYMDFVLWETARLEAGVLEAEQQSLLSRFAGELPTLDLLPDFVRDNEAQYQGDFRQLESGKLLADQIRQLAYQHDCTPYIVALSALATVLSHYSGQTDLIIGTPFSGRTDLRLQRVMGLFVSMQPIRLDLSGQPSFNQLLAHTTERVLEAEQNQGYPLLYLMRDLRVDRQSGRSPIFQTIFTYEAYDGGPQSFGHGLQLTPMPLLPDSAKFEVSFTFREHPNGATLAADFRTDLFAAETIEQLLQHWQKALELLTRKPQVDIQTIVLLSPDEITKLTRSQQVERKNDQPQYPADTVHQLVELMVVRHPDNIAVIHNQQQISYAELNQKANQMAHWLASQNVTNGDIVVLFYERGIEAIVAMLAVLKAGAAYLPLSPADPIERLVTIVSDCGATVALCDSLYRDIAEQAGLKRIADTIFQPCYEDLPKQNLANNNGPQSLMNILYTSGSTGQPKGVTLPHRGVLRLVYQANFVNFNAAEVAMQLCPLNFDGATFEIWGMLANGGTIVVADKNIVLSPPDLAKTIFDHHVTTLILTTPLLNRLIEDEPEALSQLNHIVFGGEIVSKPHMTKALQYCRPGALLHTYGPTENSFTSCFYPITEIQNSAWTIPIGQPVSETEIYILNEHLQPVPTGVVGEIYLSGQGLADGYLNDPQRTRQGFITNPFAYDQFTQRMYRTCDRGRRLRNGMIEFIGRTDNQIKIRSQRVEVGEVEEALRKHPVVAECFINVSNGHDGGKQLHAYFVPAGGIKNQLCERLQLSEQLLGEIRAFMQQRLPEYMVPTYFIALSTLPLNPNGKVNRRALPNAIPSGNALESAEASELAPITSSNSTTEVAATDSMEQIVRQIWQDILNLKSIKLHDNFFDIGGHSLALVKLQQGIAKATGILLPIADFFKYTSIAMQVGALQAQIGGADKPTTTTTAVAPTTASTAADNSQLIAIIGMGIRAPLADNVDQYWQNLIDSRDCITRFNEDEVSPQIRAKFAGHGDAWVKAGGLLNDVYGFDADFFGMSEFEARQMDPQQRILLECVADALDDGGLGEQQRKARISLFVGATPSNYGSNANGSVSGAESLVAEVSSNIAFIATRISHRLNLKGESVMVNTLCSTSLVATHMAVTSLLTGSSDYAIGGGVTIEAPQKVGYLYEPNFIMSPNGQCRTFDQDANGTVPGNGAGVVLMRRLADATKDGDPIHAIVRACTVNNDGHDKIGYYAPGAQGQAEVIQRAHRIAGVSAESIGYVEAHGTATKLGDPIEVGALTEVFRHSTAKTGFCGIGSVKSNIGHLGDAAGIAGLIKAVLCLKHKYIPATLHFNAPNPNIDFANSPFYVVAEGKAWEQTQGPRRACVSSYGIGGTNAHVILEEAP